MTPDLTLIDIGSEFWRNWYATRSEVDSYELTVERCQFFAENSTRCIVAVDRPPYRRSARFPEYKAQREPPPQQAIETLQAIEQQCEAFCEVRGAPGYEADDIIATLVSLAFGMRVAIVTQDKDLYQLISEDVSIVRKDGSIIDAEGCKRKFGVLPSQMHDWLTLVGDTADNIPGCPGVGPGKARDLLVKFGTLDAIKAAKVTEIREVRGVGIAISDALRDWDPTLARELTRLETNAPVERNQLASDWEDRIEYEGDGWQDDDDPGPDEETDE